MLNLIMMDNDGKDSVFETKEASGNIVLVSDVFKDIMEDDSCESMYLTRIVVNSKPDPKTKKHVSLEVRRVYPSSVENCLQSEDTFYYNINLADKNLRKDDSE